MYICIIIVVALLHVSRYFEYMYANIYFAFVHVYVNCACLYVYAFILIVN